MTKDAYYFSHDSNAFHDPKIIKMVMELGLISYGIYWVIVENLRNEQEYRLHKDDIQTIAYQCRCEEAIVEQIISKYQLFIYNEKGHFYSESLNKRMEIMDELKEKRIEAGRKGGIASSKARATVEHTSSTKLNYTKLNQTKLKETKEKNEPSADFKEIVDKVHKEKKVNISMLINRFKKEQRMRRATYEIPEAVYIDVCNTILSLTEMPECDYPYFMKILNLKAHDHVSGKNIQEGEKYKNEPSQLKNILNNI